MTEDLPIGGLIVTADELARDQWQHLLTRDGRALNGWSVQTQAQVLSDDGVVDAECIVIADELESYLTEDFAAAMRGARGVLGLCSSPRALAEAPTLRKYVGKALVPQQPIRHLDFHALSQTKQHGRETRQEDPGQPREQVLSFKSAENLLSRYLSEIQKFPLLTAEEEIGLAKRIEVGLYARQQMADWKATGHKPPVRHRRDMHFLCRDGERAKETFIVSNLRLVYQNARKYSQRMEIMDLIQEGNLGLIRAVEKFDYTKGFKFSTYSTWWIRQSITRAIADKSHLIRIPVHMFESDSAVLNERRRRSAVGESTRAADIAAAIGMSADEVQAAINRHRTIFSLELLAGEGFDIVDSDDQDHSFEQLTFTFLQDHLQSVLETLPERESGVVRLRFGLADGGPRTLDEIGKIYGLSRERIRQIERDAMSKLRHPSRSQVLRDYLEGLFEPELNPEDASSDCQERAEEKVSSPKRG